MNDEQIRHGSTVWIKDGLDKGRKGVVASKGFGNVSVQLEGDYKTFQINSVTTKDPNRIPLPPNFLPLDYKVGDRVEIHGHWSKLFNGIIGTVQKVPSATSREFEFAERAYKIEVTKPTDAAKSRYPAGYILHFGPDNLKKAPAPVRIEGEEIAHEDVRCGDIIRTEIKSGDGSYTQISSKEGKVHRITKKLNALDKDPALVYSFQNERNHALTFGLGGDSGEKLILVKEAESPYIQILKNLDKGTVVSFEKDSGEVLTYIKSVPWGGSSQWHEISSCSGRSSTFVTEEAIVDLLDRGVAEIVHKVRKTTVVVTPPPW